MKKIRIKTITMLVMCCFLVLLLGCHKNSGENEFTSGSEQTNYNGNKSVVHGFEGTDKGYYYLANEILYFYDIANDISMPMCSRTECTHLSENCDAYARDNYLDNDFSWICDGKELMLYNDSLYMVEHSKENGYYLVKYNISYNNKETVVQLSDFQNKSQILCANGSYAIYNSYFYYCVYDYSEAAIKDDYIFKVHCMRVKMEKDAVPEELGEFNYPGDYVAEAGKSAGISVLCHNDNVYYFASGYRRMWVHQNVEQCAILDEVLKNGKDIVAKRSQIGLDDFPLLLLYRIKKDGGEEKKLRDKMNADHDIIGISIIVSGDGIGGNHAKSIRINIPKQSEED